MDNIQVHQIYFILEIEENGQFRPFDYVKDICTEQERIGIHNFKHENGFPGYKKQDDATWAASNILQLNKDRKLRIVKTQVVFKTQKIITDKQEHVVCCMTL